MLRIKNKNNNLINLNVWERIVSYRFTENKQNMEWKEKIYITASSLEEAVILFNNYIDNKKKYSYNLENFKTEYLSDFEKSKKTPLTIKSSIYGQIIYINVV